MTTRGVLAARTLRRGYKGAGQTLRGWLSGRPSKRIQLKVRQAAAQWENRTPKPGAALAFGWRGRGGAPPACGGAAAAAVAPPPRPQALPPQSAYMARPLQAETEAIPDAPSG